MNSRHILKMDLYMNHHNCQNSHVNLKAKTQKQCVECISCHGIDCIQPYPAIFRVVSQVPLSVPEKTHKLAETEPDASQHFQDWKNK